MANDKEFKGRIQHKHDVEANWLLATNFAPKAGELIIYDVDSTHNQPRLKIGDGTTKVNALPFSNYSIDEIEAKLSNKVDKVSGKGLSANDYTTAEKNKLAGIEENAEKNVPSFKTIYINNDESITATDNTSTEGESFYIYGAYGIAVSKNDSVKNSITIKGNLATSDTPGVVYLYDGVNMSSSTVAASANSVKQAYDLANSKVPTSRTVNGKALSSNITLSASDVSAYSKSEIDSMVFITVDDIDTICGNTIEVASDSGVVF